MPILTRGAPRPAGVASGRFVVYARGSKGRRGCAATQPRSLQWWLVAGNHRLLARGELVHEAEPAVWAELDQLRATAPDLSPRLMRDPSSGEWSWRADPLSGGVLSARGYWRRCEAEASFAQFAALAPSAALAPAVRWLG